MSKENLVELIVSQNENVTKREAEIAVKMVMGGIEKALTIGADINLIGFGKFEVKDRPAREGRNPSTGEPIKIAASKAVTFKAGKKLKDAVNA
jgi:DNA-binding protein HU-beta